MGQEVVFDYDPVSGIKTYFSASGKHDEDWNFRYEFLKDPRIEAEHPKAKQLDRDATKKGIKQGFLHYAHIPDAILLLWHTQGIDIKDNAELIKMVNKREWRYLKCTEINHVARG